MKKARSLLCILVALALLSPFLLTGCGTSTKDTFKTAIQTARTRIWEDINAGKASAGSAAILDGGNPVYAEGFGVADRAGNTPVDDGTLFNVGSVSKTFCASALMVLVDEGKVELDAPVTRYIKKFKMADARYKDITVRMLLNHQSGFPGSTYANNMGYAFNKDVHSQTLENLATSHLKAAPGQTAPYCNDGFTLAEIVIERVSGKKFLDFLAEKVLHPLGLSRTGDGVGMRPDAGICRFYDSETGKIYPPEMLSIIGAGGISSTPTELVLFADSFSRGGPRVLSEKSVEAMTTASPSAYAAASVKETGINPEMTYGLGLDLTSVPRFEKQGIKVIGKGGDSNDFHTMLLSVPDKRVSVAVTEAGHGSSAADIAMDVLSDVLEAKGLMKKEAEPVVKPAPEPMPSEYASMSGYYGGGTSMKVEFDTEQNAALITPIENGVEGQPMAAEYEDGLFSMGGETAFRFMSCGGRTVMCMPVFGGQVNMTTAQLISPLAPKSLARDIDGKRWVRRNVKPFEDVQMSKSYSPVSSSLPGMPGYIHFAGTKRIESGNFAGMSVDAVRDLTELTLYNEGGITWARDSDFLYSPADGIAALPAGGKAVKIGTEGLNEWFTTGEHVTLDAGKPPVAKGRLIVYAPDGSVSYDTALDGGPTDVLPGSRVMVAGVPGYELKVTTKPVPGS